MFHAILIAQTTWIEGIAQMNTITTVSRQWASRPADERFCSLDDLLAHYATQRRQSHEVTVQTRQLESRPAGDMVSGIEVYGPNGHGYEPTHWGFGQLATLAGAPAGYLRTLPAPMGYSFWKNV